MKKYGFTLIELLIVVGVLAILATVLVLILNPTQFIAQSRDSTRMNDLQTLNKAINLSKATSSFVDSTEAKKVYVSLPDTNAILNDDCRASGEYPTLPALATGWEYRCRASVANLRKIDSMGWIPINFSSVPSIQPPLVTLPVDPINDPTNLNYYAYGYDTDQNTYALAAELDSDKYLESAAATDGGNDDSAFETRPVPWFTAGGGGAPSMTTYTGTGANPDAIAFDGTNMWTANAGDNSVTKITPTGAMTTYTGAGGVPYGIAYDGTNMWTGGEGAASVTKVTPSGAMTTYPIGNYPVDIAFASSTSTMWTANFLSNNVTKITATGVTTTYPIGGGTQPRAIAYDGTNMWTANNGNNSVTKITPSGTTTTYYGTGAGPFAIAFDGTNIWTANGSDNSVTKITTTGTMTTYPGTGTNPYDIAYDGVGNMWTANYGSNSVTKITTTGTMTTYPGTGSHPISIASDGTSMWVTNYSGNSVTKITP